ncbi:MAG: POTRA domain-containing protein [Candidatus Korobacteraceae bacterium]
MSARSSAKHYLLAAMMICVLAALASAQQLGDQQLSSYAGQNVSQVEIAGQPSVSFDEVRPLLSVHPGQPLEVKEVNASVSALKARFHGVRVDVEPEADGVQVTFILQPAMYVGMYEFPGALKEFTYPRLLQVANYNAQSPYSAVDVQQAQDALERFFRQQGYFLAEVRPEVVPDPAHGLVNVVFHTDLGILAKFGKIELRGATPQETQYLQHKLRTLMARLRDESLKTGMHYSYGRLQRATRRMRTELINQDYLSGTVKLVSAQYDPNANRADIVFEIMAGEVVKVRTAGAHMWTRTARNLIPMYQEGAVNDELIREGQKNIQSYFQSKGYFDTKVDVNVAKSDAGTSIVYDIHRDGRFKVDAISFQGNRRFSSKELQSHVSVSEGHFFSHGKYSDALVRTSVKNLRDTYRAAGYSQAEVVPQVKRNNGNIEVTFRVTEGALDTVRDLRIEGNATLPEVQFAPHGLNLGPGKAYSQDLVAKDRNQIVARYLTLGYLNAGFRASAKPVPGSLHQVDVVYQIEEGPQVITATVVTDGRLHTQQSMIDRQLRVRSGQPLSENNMLLSESHLYDLGIFDWAQVDPKRAITDQHDEDVVVKVHEAKRNSIVYGFGFQVVNRGGSVPSGTVAVPGIPPVGLPKNFITSEKTFWGPEGTFEYTRRNVRGRAESYTFSAYAGRLDQRGSLTYTDPYLFGSKWTGSALLSAEHNSQNPIFTARLGNVGYQIQKPLNKKKTTNIFFKYNFQETRITQLLIPDLVPPDQLNVHLSTVSASFIHDTRDNVLDAHRGFYESYQIGVNPAWLGSNFSFAQYLSQDAYYKDVGKGIVWANSLRIGLEQGYAGSEVPLSQKFFSGGGSTLRGFPLNGAGPQRVIAACGNPNDPATCSKITVPEGGNELLIINSELRFPLSFIKDGLGIATFYDGGNVFPDIGFHDFTSLYSNSVGIGLRYATPVGPIRIDIGHNLNPVPGISSTQVFVTLGQAF